MTSYPHDISLLAIEPKVIVIDCTKLVLETQPKLRQGKPEPSKWHHHTSKPYEKSTGLSNLVSPAQTQAEGMGKPGRNRGI